jgi:hypothetical protein
MGVLWLLLLVGLATALVISDVSGLRWSPGWFGTRWNSYLRLSGEGQRVRDLMAGDLTPADYQADMSRLARIDDRRHPLHVPSQ